MTLPYKFFEDPFGELGDLTPIPNAVQPSGSVSYEQGFGPVYEENLDTDPTALPVPRDQFNQLMNDTTLAIQHYQTVGTPIFIEAADNSGVPYSYSIFARVRYDDGGGVKIYESQIDNNITDPTNSTNWLPISGGYQDSAAVFIPAAVFDGNVTNGDMVAWNSGGSVFTRAIADGTALQNLIGRAEITASESRVMLLGTATGFSSLIAGAVYYLSNTTLGQITSTPANRNNLVRVGIAKNSTELYFRPAFVNSYRSQTITASGSFVVPINVTQIFSTLVGGGGGSGGSGGASISLGSNDAAGGGGGGGGAGRTALKTPISVVPGETLTITVGLGGVGGIAGTDSSNGGNGGDGGTTSILRGVTSLASVSGGGGGKGGFFGSATGQVGVGGDPGSLGGTPGSPGIIAGGISWSGAGGNGGNSLLGVGASGVSSVLTGNGLPGNSATLSGAGFGGGAGGASGGATGNIGAPKNGAAGGTGAPGVVLLEW